MVLSLAGLPDDGTDNEIRYGAENLVPKLVPNSCDARPGRALRSRPPTGATLGSMSDSLHLTILYEDGGDGWIVSSIPEVPGVLSQGRTKEEAREMALDALAGMLELRAAEHEPQGKAVGSESLNIVAV